MQHVANNPDKVNGTAVNMYVKKPRRTRGAGIHSELKCGFIKSFFTSRSLRLCGLFYGFLCALCVSAVKSL
jgi:hypothetical protein